ncbi:hypothetical protein GCM10023325_08700 [Sphingomonas lutea]
MSTKHVRTSADLVRFKCALRIECDGCGNAKTLDGFEVAKQLGTGTLAEIQIRLKCSLCGRKGAKLAVLSPPAAR